MVDGRRSTALIFHEKLALLWIVLKMILNVEIALTSFSKITKKSLRFSLISGNPTRRLVNVIKRGKLEENQD